ncbi:MTPN protein, partial [Pseudoatta argentina]
MERMLASVEAEAASVGLRFNPAKCATLHVGAGNGGRVLPMSFQIQGKTINPLAQDESYTHLGVPTEFSVDQTPYAAVGDIVSDLRAVDRSLLAPWQKIEMLGIFILPRLDFLLRGAKVFKGPLTALATDKHGITTLLAAIWEGHTNCVKLLLEKGAKPDGLTPDGTSYLDAAEKDEIKQLLKLH